MKRQYRACPPVIIPHGGQKTAGVTPTRDAIHRVSIMGKASTKFETGGLHRFDIQSSPCKIIKGCDIQNQLENVALQDGALHDFGTGVAAPKFCVVGHVKRDLFFFQAPAVRVCNGRRYWPEHNNGALQLQGHERDSPFPAKEVPPKSMA